MKPWSFGALACACGSVTSFGQLELISIGDLAGGEDASWTRGVSADGTFVVGGSSSALGDVAACWTPASGLQQLGPPEASAAAVNDDGTVIAGNFWDGSWGYAIALLMPGPTIVRIPISSYYDFGSRAVDVSAAGRIAGVASSSQGGVMSGGSDALVLSWFGASPSVFHRPEHLLWIEAISGDGLTVVGNETEEYEYTTTAFRYRGGFYYIGPPYPDESYATAVSKDGTVIFGRVEPWVAPAYLFRWTAWGGLEDIGWPDTDSEITSVALGGKAAAGQAGWKTDKRAILWFEGRGFVDLKQYLLARGLDEAADWQLLSVSDLSSDETTLVGNGIDRLGRERGFIVTGLDLSLCYADCDWDGELTFFDFLCFQNLFAAGDPGADCDGDGSLTFFDFLCFQNEFAAGCS
ncbi:MAG: GC-type dockerin domain-anchored protein [Phycisphaerales bacterium JB039]